MKSFKFRYFKCDYLFDNDIQKCFIFKATNIKNAKKRISKEFEYGLPLPYYSVKEKIGNTYKEVFNH